MKRARSTNSQIISALNSRKEPKQEMKTSLYGLLELTDFVSIDEVKKAYKRLAVIHHPDKGGDEETFKRISHAYFVLSDKDRKKHYDEVLKTGITKQEAQFTDESFKEFIQSFGNELLRNLKKEFKTRKKEISNISSTQIKIPEWASFYENAGSAEGIYYVVGKPITISENVGELRSNISPDEILNSFKNLDQILLIEKEYQAFEYAWATRVGNFYKDEFCAQSAFAKVKLKYTINTKPRRLQAWVNEKWSNDEGGKSTAQSDTAIYCINATMQDIILLSAELKIATLKNGLSLKKYPIIEFTDGIENTEYQGQSKNKRTINGYLTG